MSPPRTIKLPPSEDPGDLVQNHFQALWSIEDWFNRHADGLSLKQLARPLYSCLCSMWSYAFIDGKLGDTTRVLPHSLSDIFEVRDFLSPLGVELSAALNRICELTSAIPRDLWDAVGFEDFRRLWDTPYVDDQYGEALNRFYGIIRTDMGSGRTLWAHMAGFAEANWHFAVVSEDEYEAWLADEKARLSRLN